MTEKKFVRPKMSRMCLFFVAICFNNSHPAPFKHSFMLSIKFYIISDQQSLQKKTHPWHFGPNEFFCHTYDTSMTIIVTKHSIIIDVVGSYFYDKKSWHKMGFSSWAGQRRSCMTFFGSSMTEKTVVEARGRKISGSWRLRWESDARFSRTGTRVCSRRWL